MSVVCYMMHWLSAAGTGPLLPALCCWAGPKYAWAPHRYSHKNANTGQLTCMCSQHNPIALATHCVRMPAPAGVATAPSRYIPRSKAHRRIDQHNKILVIFRNSRTPSIASLAGCPKHTAGATS